MLEAIGTMPERTALNARTVATLQRNGYRIEKVIFESMPGLFVTANLFVPDGAEKRAAVVMSCGHSDTGKDAPIYLRACVLAVKKGFVALMFDPYAQGERIWYKMINSCRNHNQMGLRASLIDWSAPLLRIWDGIRAIDYVSSRPEVDPQRIGYMGQSGGGTMTALMQAVEPRIKVAAPSCYLTSLSELCHWMGPQDAEQNIYGQLQFGLNHTGYVLIPDIPVAVTCKISDMFPYYGTRTLFDTVQTLEKAIGKDGIKIDELFNGLNEWAMESSLLCYKVDEALNFYMPIYAGVDKEDGAPMWYKKGHKGGVKHEFNPETMTKDASNINNLYQDTGKSRFTPHSGGFGLFASWKGLSLQADFAFMLGKYMVNNSYFWATSRQNLESGFGADRDMLNIWKKPGDITDLPGFNYDTQFDTHLLENASFLRLKNLTVAYDLPKKWMEATKVLSAARFNFTARNVFTITQYKGADPEINTNIAYGNYPATRQFVLGVEVTF
jgi:hypothetical protein